jgi:tetratricopeptide (TPR) repeat protein
MKFILGRLSVDADAQIVSFDDRPLSAPPKVVELLAALCERRGDVLTKETLIERVWPGGYADDATLWQTVYLARRLLAKTGGAKIETHPRRGYRIVCEAAPSPRRFLRWITVAAAFVPLLLVMFAVYRAGHHLPAPALPSRALRADNLGRYYLHQRTVSSVGRAMQELEIVVRDAPDSALGYADLSQAEILRAVQTHRGRQAMLERAVTDANNALRIDPQSAIAQTALATAELYRSAPSRNIDAAFRRALTLDDEYAMAHLYYGQFLLNRGDLRNAYAHLRRATDLDPSLGYANVLLAQVAYHLGDPRTAIRYAREALGFGAADKLDTLQTLGYAYAAIGQRQLALHAFRELSVYAPRESAAGIAYVQSRIE